MANTSLRIPLLYGGVSTQAPALRFANQVSVATNALMTASAGSELRPGTLMAFAIPIAATTTLPPTTLPPPTLPDTTPPASTLTPETTPPPPTTAPATLPPNFCSEYTVSGAGSASADGVYSYIAYVNDKPFYVASLPAGIFAIGFDGTIWNLYGPPLSTVFYVGDTADTPDACAWSVGTGTAPVPTVACSETILPTTPPPTTLP